MGFTSFNPSLYQLEALDGDRSVRNSPAREAARAGPPIVGSLPIEAARAVVRSNISIGSAASLRSADKPTYQLDPPKSRRAHRRRPPGTRRSHYTTRAS